MNQLYYLAFGAFIGVLVSVYLISFYKRLKIKNRIKRAKRSEQKAIKLLESHGYDIIDIQKQDSYTLYIDGKPHKAYVKADIIARRGSKRFVAEVKSGEKVTSPRYTETRRQLLEYFLVYRPDGLILVDMEKEILRKIEYSILKDKHLKQLNVLLKYAVIFFVGFVIGFLTRGD